MRNHPVLTGEDLTQAIRDAARCRAMRLHRMEVIPSPVDRRPTFGTLITYRCELCGTIRYDNVNRNTGQVLVRAYDAPEWYAAANDGKHDPAWWRAKWWEALDDALFLDAAPITPPTPIRKSRTKGTTT